MKRSIAVFTATRADYGILKSLIRTIHDDSELALNLIVAGSHLSHKFGYTVSEIVHDEIPITEQIDYLMDSDSKQGVVRSLSLATMLLGDCLNRIKPDIIVLLGDRYEALAMAQVALLYCCPIAHIHGGELTLGVHDDSIRHAITKMASLHFTATSVYRDRVLQMGEPIQQTFNVGSLSLENINNEQLLSREQLMSRFSIPVERDFLLITYHAETNSLASSKQSLTKLLQSLAAWKNYYFVITAPNADEGNEWIRIQLRDFWAMHSNNCLLLESMGRLGYLSAMHFASAVVGNSSSGIIEAPSMGVATVNIGRRQQGRVRADSVICNEDIDALDEDIAHAIALTKKLKRDPIDNPYFKAGTTQAIINVLKTVHLPIETQFVDWPVTLLEG